jgi:predicted ATPase
VGKTRLALDVAHQHDAGSVLAAWVDLSALDDERLVPAAFAEAVGAAGASEDATGDVARFLAPLGGLLVVDNCEHVQDAVATVVMSLLETCPRVRVLATSREALRLSGEIVWSLGPLAPDDAVRLFSDRAEAVRAGAGGDRAEIERLCARLEGIPLALELAAGRMTSLSAAAILARLDDRFDLLTARTRDVPARHRSLRAAIEWSVELLDAPERDAFNRLAVFPGSFSLDAAETVAQAGLDLLEGLVAKSLVSVQGSEADLRYRMLDTIRSYSSESLEASGEMEQIRIRHLGFYVECAEDIQSDSALGGSDAQVQTLVQELHNLRLALDWAEVHDPQAGLQLIGADRVRV